MLIYNVLFACIGSCAAAVLLYWLVLASLFAYARNAALAGCDLDIMPTSTLLRATFFALGAAVGGGAVAVLNASKKRETVALPGVPPSPTQVRPPLVEVGVTGDPRFSALATTAVGPVLKYGNPGMRTPVGPRLVPPSSLTLRPFVGPISDQLVRQAYVAAYDRRLRHPAWVS